MQDLEKYFQYLPFFLSSLTISFLLTPIIGFLATKIGAIDLPSSMRKQDERGLKTRIHKLPTPKLGGLAVIIPFIIITLLSLPLNKNLIGVMIGILLLVFIGFLDDKKEVSSSTQFIFQIFAALAVVLTGTGIDVINVPLLGQINLNIWEIPVNIQGVFYHLSLPSDLITILWILLVTNSINWVAGIDGLVEGVTGISAIIITLLSIRFATHPTAIMGAVLAGGVIGFLPYNFNPAKIFSGTIGDFNYGFLLAVLSIYSGAKFATAIMLLGIPILDALWVVVYRIRKYKPSNLKQLLNAITESDKVHLHHRLVDMGLSVRQVDYIEFFVVSILGIIAFLLTGLMKTLALFIAIILGFIFIQITSKNINVPFSKKIPSPKIDEEESPEKKFAY